MYNGLKYIFTFSVGAAVGATVAWKLLKTTYEKIAQEEIDSVKEEYSKCMTKFEDLSEVCDDLDKLSWDLRNEEKKLNKEYSDIIDECNYTNSEKKEKGGSESMYKEEPYVIAPEEFAENEYETYTLTYYADGVVTDSNDEPMSEEEVDDIIGLDSLEHFGEYEEDSVYVRNDELQSDYEILKDNRNYYDLNLTDGE